MLEHLAARPNAYVTWHCAPGALVAEDFTALVGHTAGGRTFTEWGMKDGVRDWCVFLLSRFVKLLDGIGIGRDR